MRKFLSLLLTMAMVFSLAVTVNAAAHKEDVTIQRATAVHATQLKSADLLVDEGVHVQGCVIGSRS